MEEIPANDKLTVQSVTGVELTLAIAGPGTRSYAFVIDWHIRLLIAGAWLLIAYYVFHVAVTFKSQAASAGTLPVLDAGTFGESCPSCEKLPPPIFRFSPG